MKAMATIVLAAAGLMGQTTYPTRPAVRFAAVDVYVNSQDRPLAAYQFQLKVNRGQVMIVGVEGGEHEAFIKPPYYDPAALMKGRIIIAAFNTGHDLPQGKTRVARVHVQIRGEVRPEYAVALAVAASRDGKEIPATITVEQGEKK